eukprot:COSAG01_NODE_633_length_14669_cov_7.174056_7_plen_228_part_00
MARKPANPRARCRAHGSRKLELRTYTMYLTPFPASDGKSGGGGVRPVAQSSQMPPIAPGRRCRAECERALRVKQHATRPGLSGGTAPGVGRCTGQLAGRCPASRPRRPSPSARGPSRADGAATLRLTIGHWCQQEFVCGTAVRTSSTSPEHAVAQESRAPCACATPPKPKSPAPREANGEPALAATGRDGALRPPLSFLFVCAFAFLFPPPPLAPSPPPKLLPCGRA